MHYRNGRGAKNGDTIVMVDCLHLDDIADMLKERGLDKRPEGK